MKDVATRLLQCQRQGQLTTADLARWFGRPYHTVRGWLEHGYQPRGPQGIEVLRRLEWLEYALSIGYGFPLSLTESQNQRPATIERIRNELERDHAPARHSA